MTEEGKPKRARPRQLPTKDGGVLEPHDKDNKPIRKGVPSHDMKVASEAYSIAVKKKGDAINKRNIAEESLKEAMKKAGMTVCEYTDENGNPAEYVLETMEKIKKRKRHVDSVE